MHNWYCPITLEAWALGSITGGYYFNHPGCSPALPEIRTTEIGLAYAQPQSMKSTLRLTASLYVWAALQISLTSQNHLVTWAY